LNEVKLDLSQGDIEAFDYRLRKLGVLIGALDLMQDRNNMIFAFDYPPLHNTHVVSM